MKMTKWNPFRELQESPEVPWSSQWHPFQEMERWQHRMENLFGRQPFRGHRGVEKALTEVQWTPLVDITEDDKEYLVKAELPELRKEDVQVTVDNGVLTVSGERKAEKEEKKKRYHRIERSYGSFTRSFTLPEDADESKVSAEFKEGVLKVHIAKNEKARSKAINVKVQ